MHYILEAMRYAYRDRNQLGDPNFVTNPVAFLLSPAHIKSLQRNISPISAHPFSEPTSHKTYQREKLHTTHYSIVDKQGNAVAVTYTLNGPFGAKVMPEKTGVFLNNEMDDFNLQIGVPNTFSLIQGSKNDIQPKKRPLSSMTPTIILKNQQLFMVLGAPGGSTIPTQVLETIQNVLDYQLDLQTAINVPRYHMQWLPDLVFMEAHAFSEETISQLKKMNYQFKEGSPFNTPTWGAVAAIMYNESTGQLTGAIDKRRPEGSVGIVKERKS